MPDPLTQVIPLASEAATRRLAQNLAPRLRTGDVVALSGDLGAGKTTFARALIQALTSPDEEVPSPTFTLIQTYSAQGFEISHFDLYRISDSLEVVELGWDDAVASGVVLVEWPDRLGPFCPPHRLHLTLGADGKDPTARIARIQADRAHWDERLKGLTGDET